MKRMFCFLLTLVLMFSSVIVAAQAAAVDPNHTHNWVDTGDGRKPTCTEPGIKLEYCSICYTQRERYLPALGHYYSEPWEVTKEPTCTEPGEERNTCTRVNNGKVCGNLWIREIPALGHDWGDWYLLRPAKPSSPGAEERDCKRCGLPELRPVFADDEDYASDTILIISASIKNPKPFYSVDEEICFEISVTNNSSEPVYLDYTWRRMPDGERYYYEDILTLDVGETQTFLTKDCTLEQEYIDLSGEQMCVEFQCTGWPISQGQDIPLHYSNIAVCMVPLSEPGEDISDMELVVEKRIKGVSDEDEDPTYTVDDEIEFTIEVHNSQNYPLYDVVITDEDSSGNTKVLGTYEVFGPKQSVQFEYTHTVTEDECYKGVYVNKVKGEWYSKESDRGEEKNLIDDTITVDVWLEIGDMELYVEKTETSTPANGKYYVEGETATFDIDVWNCQGYTLYGVEVDDRDKDGVLSLYFGDFGPHQAEHFTVSHTVDKEDCDLGYYENTAYGRWREEPSEEADIYEITDEVEIKTGNSEGGVIVRKFETSVPANGAYYVEGETVWYKIAVTNNTGGAIYEIEVYDALADSLLYPASPLMPGETAEVSFQYTVTEADVLMGYVSNIACANYRARDLTAMGTVDRLQAWSNEVIVPTGDVLPPIPEESSVTITKKVVGAPLNGSFYVLGEIITFEVVLANDSDYEITEVEITDPILGSNEKSVLDNVSSIPAHSSLYYIVQYRVAQEDIDNGYVLNQAFADYYDTETQGFVFIGSNIVVVAVEPPIPGAPKVSLIKSETSMPVNGLYYQEGEEVTYKFVLKNESYETLYYVGVYDPLYTDGEEIIPVYKTHELGPMESVECFFTYRVTKEDVDKSEYIFNEGLVEYYPDPEGEDCTAFSNTVIVPIGKPDPDTEPYVEMSVNKTVINAPANGKWFVEGENVCFLITFYNLSDVPLYLAQYYDEIVNSDGPSGFTVPLYDKEIAPHGSESFTYTYKVSHTDVDDGYFTNVVEFLAWTEIEPYGYMAFYPFDEADVLTGPGEIEWSEPTAFKYVTSTPKAGDAYTEGEQVEYDIILFNPTGRVFKDVESYDILLTEVPGFWLNYHPLLGSEPIVEHVAYLVTEADVAMGEIFNFAWFSMVDEDGEDVPVTSNEVIVKTTADPTPPTRGGVKACCEYSIVAEGEGAATYKNDYCVEHAAVEANVNKTLSLADSEPALERAWENAAKMWQRALNDEYDHLIAEADEEMKAALKNERLLIGVYTETLKSRLTAEGATQTEISKTLADILRDRTCELCYTFGHASGERADLSGMAENEQARRNAIQCTVEFDVGSASAYTKELNVCDCHLPLLKATGRYIAAAGGDAALLSAAWDKADAIWQNTLEGLFNDCMKDASPELKHWLLKEQTAVNTFIRARTETYSLLYPENELAVKELSAELKKEVALSLCK